MKFRLIIWRAHTRVRPYEPPHIRRGGVMSPPTMSPPAPQKSEMQSLMCRLLCRDRFSRYNRVIGKVRDLVSSALLYGIVSEVHNV